MKQRSPGTRTIRAMEAEYFTSLAAEVERFVGDGKRRILLTSAGPSEGKSTITAGLGRALARSGRTSVVVVDTDHLRPTQHRLFELDNYRGLGEFLRDIRIFDLRREDPQQFGLGDWLELLQIQARSGRLRVEEGGDVFVVVLRKGAVVSISDEQATDDQRLGNLLLGQGRLTPAQHESAMQLHEESRRPMGDVLLRLGFAELEEVHQALRAQATERLRRVLTMRHPTCSFQESADGYVSGQPSAISGSRDSTGIDAYVGQRIRDYFKRPFLASKISGYLKDTEYANLKVMTSGAIPYDLIDHTSTGPFTCLLNQLAKTFDVVLIDAPPVAVASPAESISQMVDGTLLVVKSDGYDAQIVQRAKTMLEKRGAHLLGVVLNQVDLRQADPVLHYYYAYSAYRK
jgi:Mrp family chromosome partitioning ATPase